VAATSLGKRTLLHRALDYGSFHATAALALARLPRQDVVIAMTTPPLIAATTLAARAVRGTKLVYWVQDLYPEIAVAFGALREGSFAARAMASVSRRVLRAAERVVVLGDAMAQRVVSAAGSPVKVTVIPNWTDGAVVRSIPHEENDLRPKLANGARFLVMYSGNIGRAHDVETLARGAIELKERKDITFLFLGEGDRKAVLELATRGLPNVRFGPYEARERLAASLSAADAHLVSLAPNVAGLLEPSKLYGIMAVGRPALYVGPGSTEAARVIREERCGFTFANGDARGLADAIAGLADDPSRASEMGLAGLAAFRSRHDRPHATRRWRELLRQLG
jgi:glycosyltransferase involved in cell wall biosynthesis